MKPVERSKLILATLAAGAMAVILLLFTYLQRQTQGQRPPPPVASTPPVPSEKQVFSPIQVQVKTNVHKKTHSTPPLKTAKETKSPMDLKKTADQFTQILILQKDLTSRVEREDQKSESAPLEKLIPGLEQEESAALNQTNDLIQSYEKNKREASALSRVARSLEKMRPVMSDIDGELKTQRITHSAEWLDKIYGELLELLEWIDLEEERLLPLTPNPYAPTHETLDVFERRRLRQIPELSPEKRILFDLLDDAWKRTELIYLKERKVRQALILAANPVREDDKSKELILSELSLKQSNLEKQTRSIQETPLDVREKTLSAADNMNQASRFLWNLNPHAALKQQRQAMRDLEAILKDFDKIK